MKAKVTWTAAKSKCERVGAELASVKDEKENDFIAGLVVGAPKGKVAFVWLGLSKERGVWQWTDGSRATYTNWAPHEPNNSFWHAAFRGENCGGVYSETGKKWIVNRWSERGQWNDNACNWNYPFICKRPKQG
ncbi:C-type lectin lectoxin-Lio1-like [Branchiostoma floridae x Branchiostoma japonicum]